MPLQQMGKHQLQLNMHNDKNVRFIEKWEVKLLTEKKKKVIIQSWTSPLQGH